jgi:HEAT repeat protein
MIARCTLMIAVAMSSIVSAAGDDAESIGKLIAILKSDAPVFEKTRACEQLGRRGAGDAVPALAQLLGDEKLGAYARDALEKMTDPSAGDALRESLGVLKGKLLIGAVNSIGVRRDARAVEALAKLAADSVSGAAPEALLALGRIATPEALEVLRRTLASGPAELRPAAAEGCVLGAERLAAQGARDGSLALYDAVRRAEVPAALRLTATRGAILAREAEGVPLLLETLRSDDRATRAMALRAMRELPGAGVTAALAAELHKAAPGLQALMTCALADRHDPAALGAIEAAAASDVDEVRLAALKALGSCGGSSSVPILLEAVLKGRNETEVEVALAGLRRIKAPEADAAILKALPGTEGAAKIKLLEVLGALGGRRAFHAVVACAQDADGSVREAVVRVLGEWRGEEAGPALIDIARDAKDEKTVLRAFGALGTLVSRLGFPNEKKLALVRMALALAERDEEKRVLIDALGSVAAVGTFAVLGKYFKVPSLREDACKAAVAAGENLVRTAPDAVAAAMEKVRATTRTQEVAERAAKVIRRAGEVQRPRGAAK